MNYVYIKKDIVFRICEMFSHSSHIHTFVSFYALRKVNRLEKNIVIKSISKGDGEGKQVYTLK